MKPIYRGMEDGAETIQENFTECVTTTGKQRISGEKEFTNAPLINGLPIATDKGMVYKEIKLDQTINNNVESGVLRLWRIGNIVVLGIAIRVKGPLRWVDLVKHVEGYKPVFMGSFGISLGTTEGSQIKATLYASGTHFRILTDSTAKNMDFVGSTVYITEQDYPS